MAATERKWLMLGVAVIAAVMAGVTVAVVLKSARRGGAGGESGVASSQLELIAALKNPATRDATVRALKDRGDAGTVDLVANMSHKSKDADVRAACMVALGEIGDPRGLHAITVGARDVESSVRLAAVGALAKVRSQTSHGSLADALADGDPGVREAAARCLAGLPGDPLVVQRLRDALGKEPSIAVRLAIAGALGRYDGDKGEQEGYARQALVDALFSESDASVRLAVLDALLSTNDSYRVRGIVYAMGDADAQVRSRAHGSRALLTGETIPRIEAALKSGEFGGVIRGGRGKEVLVETVRVLDGLAAPAACGPLLRIAQMESARDKSGRLVLSEPGEKAVAALARLGGTAVDCLARSVLQPDAPMVMKQVAAEVLARVGTPSVKAIRDYSAAWKVFPSAAEALLWGSVLARIGGAEAEEAARVVRERDPAVAFAKAAENTAQSPAAPAVPVARDAPARRVPPGTGFDGELQVILRGAVYSGNPPSAYAKRAEGLPWENRKEEKKEEEFKPSGRADLRLHLAAEGGVWERVFGYGMNQAVHIGHVAEATVNGNSMTLLLKIGLGSDPWLVGGYGEYKVEMERGADGSFTGTYRGKSRELPIEGKADVTMKPRRPPMAADFRPVMAGEHPRMLFRAHDLPKVRARLNTALGRAAFERFSTSGDPTLLGMAYQLTGDPRYAEKAMPAVRSEMANHDFGFMGLGQVWGGRLSMIAVAYDLCHAAWPPEFRDEVCRFLVKTSKATATNMGKFSTCANWAGGSNYFAPIQGGGAMLSLAYWADRGARPSPPPPGTVVNLPATGVSIDGVKAEPLETRVSPRNWLWTGPIPGEHDPDAMLDAMAGDPAAIREGAPFKFNAESGKFLTAPAEYQRSDGFYPWLGMQEMFPGRKSLGFVLHALLLNQRAGFYKVTLPVEGTSALRVSGTNVYDKAVVRLEQGLYPVTMAFAKTDDVMGSVFPSFAFISGEEKDARDMIERNREQWGKESAWHEADLADWERTGMGAEKLRNFSLCRAQMYRCYRMLMGDGGFQNEGETYTHHAMTPLRYAAAYRNMFGRTLSPHPDATHFPFRYMVTSVLQDGGRGDASLLMQAFNGADGIGAGVQFMIVGFPIIPDEYKPGVLWIWNRLRGVDPEKPETLANLIRGGGGGEPGSDFEAVYAFLNYPLDMKPVHPSRCFPRAYQARTRGLYMFRNRWEDRDDVVFQVYANQVRSCGHGQQNSAALRLYGFGKVWARTSGGRDAFRQMESVVVLPDDDTMAGDAGYVTSWSAAEDGSGHVTIDLDDVYAAGAGAGGRFKQNEWGDRQQGARQTNGIRGLRAAAVDYSGKCGAPALFVLVDRITGGGNRKWLWQLPDKTSARVSPDGRSFLVTQGDATMKATFIAPDGVKIESPGVVSLPMGEKEVRNAEGRKVSEKLPPKDVPVGVAASGAPGTSFFVVLTLQKGAAPEVVVEKGEGLDSVVRVGEKRVSFDGGKVVIADR